jgi:hypothetical protein
VILARARKQRVRALKEQRFIVCGPPFSTACEKGGLPRDVESR